MYQQHHPRPPPTTASPANSEQTNPTRTNNSRDRPAATPPAHGLESSDDFVSSRQEHQMATTDPAASTARLNQVIQNFHTKAALIILHSRVELSPAYSTKTNDIRVNKWFNIELDETEDYADDIRIWKRCDVKEQRPPPLVIEFSLQIDSIPPGQRLVILDEDQKRWDVYNALESLQSTRNSNKRPAENNELILERWTIQLDDSPSPIPSDLTSLLPLVYKKSIVLFRSLYTYCNFMPAWKLIKKFGRSRSTTGMKVAYRIVDGTHLSSLTRPDNLGAPLYGSASDVLDEYDFGSTDSPAGSFSVKVQFRHNCDFRVDDSEELLSSRFIGDDMFKPSMPRDARTDDAQRMGSLPTDQRRNLIQRPELGHAYGSLSTFHQAGISPGTSPISALRAAKELGSDTPNEYNTSPPSQAPLQRPYVTPKTNVSVRRSSLSFQPFKAPALSASPHSLSPSAASPRPSSRAVPTLGSLTEENTANLSHPSASRQPSAVASVSSSPKPASVQRFSSSFSHRRNRLSLDRTAAKTEEDQTSSGKQSAASSAQPGSALTAEVAQGDGSSGSMQEDDENISDFLKMLDQKKDLLKPGSSSAVESAARQTAAALNRFQKMRDSNAALSDSMSSSLVMQKPSSSGKPLPSSSTSVSPGKPVSPHTPHTPFAPSRLSAAYSHDDMQDSTKDSKIFTEPEDEIPRTATTLSPIAIPSSPGPFNENYRRSSSAQRQPLPSEDDIGDLYGMRSASMGAQAKGQPLERRKPFASDEPEQLPARPRTSAGDGQVSEYGSGRSSGQGYSSRYPRGGASGRVRYPSPLQGSTSSLGAGGGSLERGDSGSASGSWGTKMGRHNLTMTKPDVKSDEDEFLPFAMESSSVSPGPRRNDR